jgi:hypothetical protein
MAEATIGALANLATATATDRGVVATLTEANGFDQATGGQRHRVTRAQGASEEGDYLKKRATHFQPFPEQLILDAWLQMTNTHTILSCNFPNQGHKREATRFDNMGNTQANKE